MNVYQMRDEMGRESRSRLDGRWRLIFVLPRRFRSRDMVGGGSVVEAPARLSSHLVRSVLQEVWERWDPYFKLGEADHVLVRLALFGKVRLFIGSSPGEAIGIGQRHPICSAFRYVGWINKVAGDAEIRVLEFPGGETRLRRRWSVRGRQAR